ncbi:hypothetical protein D3C87_1232400 [compost metagenome]
MLHEWTGIRKPQSYPDSEVDAVSSTASKEQPSQCIFFLLSGFFSVSVVQTGRHNPCNSRQRIPCQLETPEPNFGHGQSATVGSTLRYQPLLCHGSNFQSRRCGCQGCGTELPSCLLRRIYVFGICQLLCLET